MTATEDSIANEQYIYSADEQFTRMTEMLM
jgi:hypothetical protein